jgi:formylglycine-generating enzyme required for sulfatase activity
MHEPFANSIGMTFVPIAAGTFTMGSPHSDLASADNEKPGHRVEISHPFYLGTYAVTQAQWEAVMGYNPSHFKGDPERPVEGVSWDEAQRFIEKLAAQEGVTTYRLPTEAEWEYVARAGTATVYSFGDNAVLLGEYAWYSDNAGGTTHAVGQRQPNDWGLYDMHGNVWEWVQDWYSRDYYQQSPRRDPPGPTQGRGRVLRGGSWFNGARSARSAQRTAYAPDYSNFIGSIGFRVALERP